MAFFQKTGNQSTSDRGFQALDSSRLTSSTSEDGSTSEKPLQLPRRTGATAQSRHGVHSPWVQRLRSVACQCRRSRGRILSTSWDLHQREEKSSSPCAIRAWDLRVEKIQENNSPQLRTPDVTDGRRIQEGERNIPFLTDLSSSFSSSRHVGKFSENLSGSSENTRDFRTGEAAEPGERSLESSQLVGSITSQHFVQSTSANKECLFNSPSSSLSPPKVWDTFKTEKSEMGKLEDRSRTVGAQRSMDVLASFEHTQLCSVGKGLHQKYQGTFPFTGTKSIPWSTELSPLRDTCSTSSSALIKNLHCNNIEVSRPLVLENNSDANKTAIYGKYAHREKILHLNKYNSQTFSGVKGTDKNGQVRKQLEIVDGNSGLSAGTSNVPKTENLWTSRFREKSLPNKATQEGGNIDGPLQGSSEDVIVRGITKDKGVHGIHAYSGKEKPQTLSSLLWLQHWHCSNVPVTQRLIKTCVDPNQNCQSDSVIKGAIDSNTTDASGSSKIIQDPVKHNSVERG